MLVTLTTASLVATPVGADQLANERAYAASLATQIAALGQHEAALGEQYDAGVVALQQADARVSAAASALTSAKVSQRKTVVLLRQDAVQAYVGGGPQLELAGPVALTNLNQALLRQELEQTFASHETDALDNYQLAAAQESTAEAQFELARNADSRRLAALQTDRQQVQAAQDRLVGVQQQVKGEIAALVAEIERARLLAEQQAEEARLAQQQAAAAAAAARQAAAAAAAAAVQQAAQARVQQAAAEAAQQQATAQAAQEQAAQQQAAQQAAADARQAAAVAADPGYGVSATTTVPSSGAVTSQQLPGVSQAASVAVAAAESRVGDPYVWGAAGPSAFDCSGLVMWAYAQAGVYLPHFSGAQYDDTTHIPMSDLEPGDLVFPGDPGQHVAMYIGNGEIVQAPYTGADVQIIPLSSFFVLASRVG